MPGMMDTVLNLGLNDDSVKGLAAAANDERFAYDCYRRFIQMYADVVQNIEHYKFEQALEAKKQSLGVNFDNELDAAALKELVDEFKVIVMQATKKPFPQDPVEQLILAIQAVFESWNNQRAIVYRQIHKIPDDLGTAVNVQMMVFGNLGDDSGTGVAFITLLTVQTSCMVSF